MRCPRSTYLDTTGQTNDTGSYGLLLAYAASEVRRKITGYRAKALGDGCIEGRCHRGDGKRGSLARQTDINGGVKLVRDRVGVVEDVIQPMACEAKL